MNTPPDEASFRTPTRSLSAASPRGATATIRTIESAAVHKRRIPPLAPCRLRCRSGEDAKGADDWQALLGRRSVAAATEFCAVFLRAGGDIAAEAVALELVRRGEEARGIAAHLRHRLCAVAQGDLVGEPRQIGIEPGLGMTAAVAAEALDHLLLIVLQRLVVAACEMRIGLSAAGVAHH